MNTKRYMMAGLTAGIWILVYGFVANAIILADFWASHSQPGLMRPEGEEVMWAVVASCLLQGFILSLIFTRGYENRGLGEGARFGLLIAVFVAAIYLLFFALQPWSMTATMASMVTDGLMYLGAGVIIAAIYRS
jgi:hypothetical protein